ncbi:GroES-like protein [Cadophora sp. DSE1049]|nr:GroES-like protein [Cadophora sp. DSE1049]
MMKALVSNRSIGARILKLASGKSFGKEVLVKVHTVALNPTDFKHVNVLSPQNVIIGCDYAGEVVSVGKEAQGGRKVGDRLAGLVHGGMYHDRGSFAEYLKIDGDLAWKIPDGIHGEEAATARIPAKAPTILIYAASTSNAFPDIKLAVDCYSEGNSTGLCAKVLKAAAGGKVITLLDTGKPSTPGVEYESILVYNLFGESIVWLPPIGPKFPAIPSDRTSLARLHTKLPHLVSDFKPPPIRLIEGGFDGIIMGLGELRQGKVSGGKSVAKL